MSRSSEIFLRHVDNQVGIGALSPPWTEPPTDGRVFTVPFIDNAPDFHGDVNDPDLVVFFNGNQFMAVNALLKAFKRAYPEYRRVFAETLPPGVLVEQIEAGALILGNMRISVRPDVLTDLVPRIKRLDRERRWFVETRAYVKNRLAIMVPEGNPKGIRTLEDLARPDVRVAMPNPRFEGVAKLIEEAYVKAGGEPLRQAVMETKVADGTTVLTSIHHRQTPMWMMLGLVDAGPVWDTEAYHQMRIGHPVGVVEIPEAHNVTVTYMAGLMKDAPRPQAGRDFMEFLLGREGQAIYEACGFVPVGG